MPWLSNEEMANVHIIRQDFARTLSELEVNPTTETATAFADVEERRARAIRSLHRDDDATVRQLAAMFRCNKNVVRLALEEEE